jgi:hypothetical protein
MTQVQRPTLPLLRHDAQARQGARASLLTLKNSKNVPLGGRKKAAKSGKNFFSSVTTVYSEAVRELASQTGISSIERYQELLRDTNVMRLRCEDARLRMENHMATHRC